MFYFKKLKSEYSFIVSMAFFKYIVGYIDQEGGQYRQFTRCEHFWTFLVKVARGE